MAFGASESLHSVIMADCKRDRVRSHKQLTQAPAHAMDKSFHFSVPLQRPFCVSRIVSHFCRLPLAFLH